MIYNSSLFNAIIIVGFSVIYIVHSLLRVNYSSAKRSPNNFRMNSLHVTFHTTSTVRFIIT